MAGELKMVVAASEDP